MQLFRSLSRSAKLTSFARPAYLTHTPTQYFTAKAAHLGDETSIGDVGDIFKVNYTVEFE